MNDKITLELTREELRTVFFACNKQIVALNELVDGGLPQNRPTMESSIREEIASLSSIVAQLSAASH